jgi:hypothetical protein
MTLSEIPGQDNLISLPKVTALMETSHTRVQPAQTEGLDFQTLGSTSGAVTWAIAPP